MPKTTDFLDEELKRQLEEKALLEQEIRDLEQEPDRIRGEQEERSRMLPPWEELADRKRQNQFETSVSRWELTNKRRELTRSILLMILLVMAVLASFWWVFQFIQRMGV
jgi:hypothetical protein